MDTNLAVLMALNAVAVTTHPVMTATAPIPDNTTEFDRTLYLKELEGGRIASFALHCRFCSEFVSQ